MNIEVLKSKIHRVTVAEARLDYIGSITIDEDLLDAVFEEFCRQYEEYEASEDEIDAE